MENRERALGAPLPGGGGVLEKGLQAPPPNKLFGSLGRWLIVSLTKCVCVCVCGTLAKNTCRNVLRHLMGRAGCLLIFRHTEPHTLVVSCVSPTEGGRQCPPRAIKHTCGPVRAPCRLPWRPRGPVSPPPVRTPPPARPPSAPPLPHSPDRVRLAWAASAVDASFQHESSLIVGLAKTGEVARLISQFRPRAHLLLAVPDEALCRRLLLYHGIRPVHTPQLLRRDSETEVSMIHHLVEVGKRQGICQKGGVVVGVHKEYLQKDKWISLLKFLHVE